MASTYDLRTDAERGVQLVISVFKVRQPDALPSISAREANRNLSLYRDQGHFEHTDLRLISSSSVTPALLSRACRSSLLLFSFKFTSSK